MKENDGPLDKVKMFQCPPLSYLPSVRISKLNISYFFHELKFYLTGNPLDDCNFVYLDMGTNFGVQIR